MNKVILMGRLTRDPEVRYGGSDNQMAIARFSLAVDRRFRRQGDSVEADFFNCTAFGKLGEFVERYLKQGTKVALTGRIQNDNYTNKEGQKVYSVQIIAEEIEFAESKNAGGGSQQSAPAPAPQDMVQPVQAQPVQAQSVQAQPVQAQPVQTQPVEQPSAEFQASAVEQPGFMNIPDGVDEANLPFN